MSKICLPAKGEDPSGCTLTQALRATEAAVRKRDINRLARTSRLVQKDPTGLELWQTEHGPFWIESKTFMPAFYQLLAEDEHNIYGAGEQGVRAGDIVLDCGAAHGTYTRKALWVGANLVVAIEPAPDNLACVQRTFAKEIQDGRVVVYPKGVWDRDDKLVLRTIPNDPYDNSFVRLDPNTAGPTVPLTTIDHLAAELKLARVDFIKMDIEGAEQKAIAGARETLVRYKPRMAISVNHLPEDPVVVPNLVRAVVPTYRVECRCTASYNKIQPAVVNFY